MIQGLPAPLSSITIPANVAKKYSRALGTCATMTIQTGVGAARVVSEQLPVAIDPANHSPKSYRDARNTTPALLIRSAMTRQQKPASRPPPPINLTGQGRLLSARPQSRNRSVPVSPRRTARHAMGQSRSAPGWNNTTSTDDDDNRLGFCLCLGFCLGAGAQSSNDCGPDAVHNSDQRTARHLGSRVAKLG